MHAALPRSMKDDTIDALELLRTQHQEVEDLIGKIEKTEDAGKKSALFIELADNLAAHATIEEKIFYPAAREHIPETTDHVLESIEEHHVVVWMLSELNGMDPKDERFTAKVTVLMENVRHHVEEEEDEWFPQVRKAMGRKILQELGERMEAAKAEAPDDPLKLSSAIA